MAARVEVPVEARVEAKVAARVVVAVEAVGVAGPPRVNRYDVARRSVLHEKKRFWSR